MFNSSSHRFHAFATSRDTAAFIRICENLSLTDSDPTRITAKKSEKAIFNFSLK
jgi:hypothetical protein